VAQRYDLQLVPAIPSRSSPSSLCVAHGMKMTATLRRAPA